ncbi:MAG: hypothetical protein ACXWP5_15055, partial [Bdellovibrionota bacterium]
MVNQRFTRILAIAMIAAQLLTVPAFAREDVIPGSRYTAAREAALGGAFLPLGEDGPSALFSNPANVGKFKVTNIEPVNAAIYLNGPFFTTLGFNSWNIWSLAGLAPTLLANPTQAVGAGASFIPSFYTHFSIFSFALGVLLQSQVSAFAS